jgi:hypothetical protein
VRDHSAASARLTERRNGVWHALGLAEAGHSTVSIRRGLVEGPQRVGTRHLPCVSDRPTGVHTQVLTITGASVTTRPACVTLGAGRLFVRRLGLGLGASSPRGHSEQSARAIAGAARDHLFRHLCSYRVEDCWAAKSALPSPGGENRAF